MQGVLLVLLGWLLGAFPAQTRELHRIVVEHQDDACSALTPSECCAQMLEIAMFRATGEPAVPKAAKTPVRLSCQQPDHTIPETACRLIAMGRGFNARDAGEICAPAGLAKRCSDDGACKQCMTDLERLAWKAPQRACYALTYVPKVNAEGARVVTLNRADTPAANGGQTVRVRRLIVR